MVQLPDPLEPRPGRPAPPELRALFLQIAVLDGACAALLIGAVLIGNLLHQVVLAVVIGMAGLSGMGLVWIRFFRRLVAYRRKNGLPV